MTVPANWPFAQPPNLAILTVRQVLDGSQPVLYVSHNADNGGWQFLTGFAVEESDAKVVSLGSMVLGDPSLAQLADLPKGYVATRASVGAPLP
jgi:hypothetical protein